MLSITSNELFSQNNASVKNGSTTIFNIFARLTDTTMWHILNFKYTLICEPNSKSNLMPELFKRDYSHSLIFRNNRPLKGREIYTQPPEILASARSDRI